LFLGNQIFEFTAPASWLTAWLIYSLAYSLADNGLHNHLSETCKSEHAIGNCFLRVAVFIIALFLLLIPPRLSLRLALGTRRLASP